MRWHVPRRPLVVLLLIAITLTLVPFLRYALIPREERAAVRGLRHTSVFLAPGQDAVLDKAHLVKVIGDRPIEVAVLAASYDGRALTACDDIARAQTGSILLVYKGRKPGSYPAICAGSSFPEPHVKGPHSTELGTKTDVWLQYSLASQAQNASRLRVAGDAVNRTPEVEELVLAFDALAVTDYPHGVPRRSTQPDAITFAAFVLNLVLFVLLLLGAYVLIRWLVGLVTALRASRSALGDRRAEVGARLSEAGGLLLSTRPDAPGRGAVRQATVGQLYVEALTAFEQARSLRDLSSVDELVHGVLRAERSR